jgi:hypothetical protein
MFQLVTEPTLTFGTCSSSFPVRGSSVCCSSLPSSNICITFVAWDVLSAHRIVQSHETACVCVCVCVCVCGTRIRSMVQHRDLPRKYLVSVYGLVGWRDKPLNVQYVIIEMLRICEHTCYDGVPDS